MAFQFQSVASTAPFLIDAFAIDFTRLGALIGLYMLPGIFIALPGGVLAQRFGARNLVLTGLLLMASGGFLMGGGTSFLLIIAGRLISGGGAVLINVLMTKMVTDWFANREIVTAMAVLVVSWPLGIALGLLLFTPLAASQSWNAVMYAAALLALASFFLVASTYRDPPGPPAASSSRLNLALTRHEWLCVSLAGSIWMTCRVHRPDQFPSGTIYDPRLFFIASRLGRQFLGLDVDTLGTVGWRSRRAATSAKLFLGRRPFDHGLSCGNAATRA